jgi:peptidoglycan/xylan/chitin deacetylase (PgdA/CDA1 family)
VIKKENIAAIFFKDLTWSFPGQDKELYLTFDDGPTSVITEWVLSVLREYNAKATFFCIGKNAENNPEILRQIIDEGHSIGNHGYSHIKGWCTSNKKYLQNIRKASEYINSNLYRPPYGRIKPSQIKQLKKDFHIIMWDVLTRDYNNKLSKEKCLKKTLKSIKPGSIIVFHDTLKAEKNLKYVLPKVLKFYSEKGFQFNSIDFSDISSKYKFINQ